MPEVTQIVNIKIDLATQNRIALLHPTIREEVKRLVAEANAKLAPNVQMRIVQGFRSFAEQDALFLKRPRVTRARGGQSNHNYGVAIDFALLINGNEISWDMKKDMDNDNQADWIEVVQTFVKAGWYWGNTFGDFPHLTKVKELSWKELLVKYKNKDFIAGTQYVNL